MVGRTTVVVAHRLSTVRNADIIAVVHGGKIVESGSHYDLISNPDGAYSSLLRIQEAANPYLNHTPSLPARLLIKLKISQIRNQSHHRFVSFLQYRTLAGTTNNKDEPVFHGSIRKPTRHN